MPLITRERLPADDLTGQQVIELILSVLESAGGRSYPPFSLIQSQRQWAVNYGMCYFGGEEAGE